MGESLCWFQLADRLHMPIQRCKAETSSTDFVLWMRYIEQIEEEPTRQEYYLMQIAAEIFKKNMSKNDAAKVKLDLFKLGCAKSEKKRTLAEYLKESKNFFAGMIGLGKHDK